MRKFGIQLRKLPLAWLVFVAGLGTMGRQVDKRLARQLLATALRATHLAIREEAGATAYQMGHTSPIETRETGAKWLSL